MTERGKKGSDEEDVITGIPSATHCKQFLQRPHNSAHHIMPSCFLHVTPLDCD